MLQILINSFVSASIFLLVGLSFSILYSTSRFFNISQAVVITGGAYAMFVAVYFGNLPLWISFFFGIALAAAIGVIFELSLFRTFRHLRMSSWGLLITSLGVYTIFQNVISIWFDDITRSVRLGAVRVGHELLGAFITDIQLLTLLVSLGGLFFVTLLLRATPLGLAIRGISSNSELSINFGINTEQIILIATLVSSVLAGVTGMLSALDTDMSPTMGFRILMSGIIVMIISGIGSYPSLVGGAIILALAQHSVVYFIGSQWMDAVSFLILIAFLIWKPLGFSGRRLKKIEI